MDNDADSSTGAWWDWYLFGMWVLVNGVAFVVIPVAGAILERLASAATTNLVQDHRALAVVIIAVVGASLQGMVLGRWQWRLLQRRVPDLPRRRWVIATLAPALIVWLLAIAPAAVDILARGGSTVVLFRNGFIQALGLGPLIGLSQASALRGLSSRWAWWVAANATTYLVGAALHTLGVWLQRQWFLPAVTPAYFPLVAFGIYGAWMLWVTAPRAVGRERPAAVQV